MLLNSGAGEDSLRVPWPARRSNQSILSEDEMVGWHHWLDGHEWASSGSWWWTGKPGVLQSMGSQSRTRQRLDWTEQSPATSASADMPPLPCGPHRPQARSSAAVASTAATPEQTQQCYHHVINTNKDLHSELQGSTHLPNYHSLNLNSKTTPSVPPQTSPQQGEK